MKEINSILISIFITQSTLFAQNIDCGTTNKSENINKDLSSCFADTTNYLLDKTSSSPYSYNQSPIYTIQLKVHVMQYSSSDPRNYTVTDIPDILSVLDFVNDFYTHI